MKKGIIFDLDGTLWDASEEVTRSWNMALENISDFNLRIDKNDMMTFMGNLLFDIGRMMLPKNLTDEKVQEIITLCIEYEHNYLRKYGAPLYENMRDTLKKLKKDYSLFDAAGNVLFMHRDIFACELLGRNGQRRSCS